MKISLGITIRTQKVPKIIVKVVIGPFKKCSSYQIWGPKWFKVTVSLRINVGAFIGFSSSWRPFIRGSCLIDVLQYLMINQIWIRKKYNLKEQIDIWILNIISGAGVALGFQKLTFKIRTFQAQSKNYCFL